jgi:hypothetical protein
MEENQTLCCKGKQDNLLEENSEQNQQSQSHALTATDCSWYNTHGQFP